MDFSILKPVDLWFWFFIITSFITIVSSFVLIKNHSELKWLIILRSLTFILLILLLLQPKFSWVQYKYNSLDWNIYIDNSVSTSYHPSLSFQTMKTELDQMIYNISKKNIFSNLYSFSGNINKINNTKDLIGDGSSTDLGKVLSHIQFNQNNLAGAIIISDGQNNRGNDPYKIIKNIKVPVYSLGIEGYEKDVSCTKCYKKSSDSRKNNFRERSKQVELAKERDQSYIYDTLNYNQYIKEYNLDKS